ncbi:MAG: ABC transporter permease [Oscillospiraceae bacterium]|jgi:spermidine/putrescine transport system permease protein|nr:ABC transporter permease [Oscillospiraceae bacterium]
MSTQKPRFRVFSFALQGLLYIFLYAPIFVMAAFSFNNSKSRSVWTGFTLKWYGELFRDRAILEALVVTLSVAIIASLAATIIGTAAALGIHRMRKKTRDVVMTVNNIPVVNPDILTGVSFMLLFVAITTFLRTLGADISLGYWSLLLAHITFNIPYIILSVMPKLRQMNKHTLEAALDLGATPFQGFRKVILPEIMPGVVSGMMIAFTMSIDDFVISYFTSGSSVQTLSVAVYAMTRKRINPEINALSTIMFVSVMLLLVIINVIQAKDKNKEKKF